MQRDRIKRKTA
ncbi:hypothetical protein SpCBS45565_g05886 [Spizellomyces sp. 'palustris']|nr:hypothetical protein SpCBS45565_g05886 [Spizellomyces sp. 'palustris']